MKNLRLTPFDTIFIVKELLIENPPKFQEFKMYDSSSLRVFIYYIIQQQIYITERSI